MSRIVSANEKIAQGVVSGYKKIENGVVGGYMKIENGVVNGFHKVSDKCVEKMFARKGETVEEAKARLAAGAENAQPDAPFYYCYNPAVNEEVAQIRRKYLPREEQEETKMEELERLDRTVENAGIREALCMGVIGTLVFGLGLSLALQTIASGLFFVILGVVVCLPGVVGIAMAYPTYCKHRARAKETYTPRILELTEELSGEISKD